MVCFVEMKMELINNKNRGRSVKIDNVYIHVLFSIHSSNFRHFQAHHKTVFSISVAVGVAISWCNQISSLIPCI